MHDYAKVLVQNNRICGLPAQLLGLLLRHPCGRLLCLPGPDTLLVMPRCLLENRLTVALAPCLMSGLLLLSATST
jgi:hypothetical protein